MTLDEAIRFTKQALENVNPDKRVHYEFRFTFEQIKQLLEWLWDYKELKAHFESLPDWIPVLVSCEEAMPEKDGEYLCVSDGEFKILIYRNGEFYENWLDAICCWNKISVTNWMPLPELPKTEGKA